MFRAARKPFGRRWRRHGVVLGDPRNLHTTHTHIVSGESAQQINIHKKNKQFQRKRSLPIAFLRRTSVEKTTEEYVPKDPL